MIFIKHFFLLLLIMFSVETFQGLIPETDKKLIQNIRKRRERKQRKRQGGKEKPEVQATEVQAKVCNGVYPIKHLLIKRSFRMSASSAMLSKTFSMEATVISLAPKTKMKERGQRFPPAQLKRRSPLG
jgi:hypothetical protein